MLHAALRHGDRCGTRDPYLFNIACDYVVNGWLVEMRVGTMPEGLLHDPRLAGLSAEEVYDRIAGDLRRMRRLATPRGKGAGDVLGGPLRPPGDYVDLDEFYRRGLSRGLDLHQAQERGFLPGGLVAEIRALSHPPLPWDARLARWFDEFVPRPEPVRTYARPARRQAATPDIRARAGTSRRRRSPAAPSSGPRHLRLDEPHPARQGARRDRLLRRVPRRTGRPRGVLRTPPRTTPAICRSPRSPAGYGCAGAAVRSFSPASTCCTGPRTSRPPRRCW